MNPMEYNDLTQVAGAAMDKMSVWILPRFPNLFHPPWTIPFNDIYFFPPGQSGGYGSRFLYMSPDEWHQGAQLAEKAIDLFPGAPFSYWHHGKSGINWTHDYVLLL